LVTKRDLKEEVQEKILIVVRCLKRMRPNVFSRGFCRTVHAKLLSLTLKLSVEKIQCRVLRPRILKIVHGLT